MIPFLIEGVPHLTVAAALPVDMHSYPDDGAQAADVVTGGALTQGKTC